MTRSSLAAVVVMVLGVAAAVRPARGQEATVPTGGVKRVEFKAADAHNAALDVRTGALFFTVNGSYFYYQPTSTDISVRVIELTGLMAEMRLARTVVVTFADPSAPGSESSADRVFPGNEGIGLEGQRCQPVKAFYLRYY